MGKEVISLKSEHCYCGERGRNQNHPIMKGRYRIPVHFPRFDCVDCGHFFEINLAGLTDSMNFKLIELKGHEVEIETTLCAEDNKIKGEIHNIGIDYIDLLKENGVIVTILKDKISQIHWLNEGRVHQDKYLVETSFIK